MIHHSGLSGWAAFFIYCIAAWLCWRNARAIDALPGIGPRHIAQAKTRGRLWLALAAMLLLLGLTRIFGIQTLLADLARDVLHADGVYGERSGLQVGLIIAIGVFGAIGMLIILIRFRRTDAADLVAAAGVALLTIFTLIRTISLHDVDHLLARGTAHLTVNALIELGLLAVITLAACASAHRLRGEQAFARLRAVSIRERRRRLGEKRRGERS